MTQQRKGAAKIAGARQAFAAFRDEITDETLRQWMATLNEAATNATTAGNMDAYVELVRLSLQVQRVIAGNDRSALLAAVLATQSGVSRPVFNPDDGE